MELTAVQDQLIQMLKDHKVHIDQAIPMMVFFKDNEKGMNELIDYMEQNEPTAHQIIKKSVEILSRTTPPENN